MIHLLLLLAVSAEAELSFTKTFPGSMPPYVGITVEKSGNAVFRTAPDDDQPITFKLSEPEAAALFEAAGRVDLSQALESPAKVAKMGQKTIRYIKEGKPAEQTFNFTDNLQARELTDWFERISESEMRYIDLERAVKYDKIGVNQALLGLQSSWERKRLVAASQYLPLLDRIIKSESYLQMARHRAADLATTFRSVP